MHMDIFAAANSAIDLLAQCEFGEGNGSKWDGVKLTAGLIGNHACFCLCSTQLVSSNRAPVEHRVELIRFMRRQIWARGRYSIIFRAQNRD